MSEPLTGIEKEVKDEESAFTFPMDTSKVYTNASITLGVEHHVLRPDEWLILRSIDWFQNLINVFLGAWMLGFISVIIKLLIEHFSEVKIRKLEISELWIALACFLFWLLAHIIYKGRFNQRFKFTQVDRQLLVDDIDRKLKLKYKRNER